MLLAYSAIGYEGRAHKTFDFAQDEGVFSFPAFAKATGGQARRPFG